jgi:hypothetical protein
VVALGLNVNEHSHPVSFHVQARQAQKPAQKNKNVKRATPVEILKPHPCKQEKITNARALLRGNDVRGAQMKSVTFVPLTS